MGVWLGHGACVWACACVRDGKKKVQLAAAVPVEVPPVVLWADGAVLGGRGRCGVTLRLLGYCIRVFSLVVCSAGKGDRGEGALAIGCEVVQARGLLCCSLEHLGCFWCSGRMAVWFTCFYVRPSFLPLFNCRGLLCWPPALLCILRLGWCGELAAYTCF
jgi:hypothetical protein